LEKVNAVFEKVNAVLKNLNDFLEKVNALFRIRHQVQVVQVKQ